MQVGTASESGGFGMNTSTLICPSGRKNAIDRVRRGVDDPLAAGHGQHTVRIRVRELAGRDEVLVLEAPQPIEPTDVGDDVHVAARVELDQPAELCPQAGCEPGRPETVLDRLTARGFDAVSRPVAEKRDAVDPGGPPAALGGDGGKAKDNPVGVSRSDVDDAHATRETRALFTLGPPGTAVRLIAAVTRLGDVELAVRAEGEIAWVVEPGDDRRPGSACRRSACTADGQRRACQTDRYA